MEAEHAGVGVPPERPVFTKRKPARRVSVSEQLRCAKPLAWTVSRRRVRPALGLRDGRRPTGAALELSAKHVYLGGMDGPHFLFFSQIIFTSRILLVVFRGYRPVSS